MLHSASHAQPLTLKVNGETRTIEGPTPDTPLLYILRNDCELNGPKYGCGINVCKACTSHINGRAFNPCSVQVKDIQHLLQRMRERFAIRPGQFQALYDQIKTMQLGHLAGGVHRDGQDFFNVYYGAVRLPRKRLRIRMNDQHR